MYMSDSKKVHMCVCVYMLAIYRYMPAILDTYDTSYIKSYMKRRAFVCFICIHNCEGLNGRWGGSGFLGKKTFTHDLVVLADFQCFFSFTTWDKFGSGVWRTFVCAFDSVDLRVYISYTVWKHAMYIYIYKYIYIYVLIIWIIHVISYTIHIHYTIIITHSHTYIYMHTICVYF